MIEVDIKDVSRRLEVSEDLDSSQSCCHLDLRVAGLQVFRGIDVQDISVYNVLWNKANVLQYLKLFCAYQQRGRSEKTFESFPFN